MIYPQSGPLHTAQTIQLAQEAAASRGIGHIVVASSSGKTAQLLLDCPQSVICVTHAYGFAQPGRNEMPDSIRASLESAGMRILSTTHVLSGVERGISRTAQGMYPAEIMANTLRMLGQGTKVCVEIAIMALDSGLLPYGEPVIAIGGSGNGADTAWILTPAHASHALETKLHELLCKPF